MTWPKCPVCGRYLSTRPWTGPLWNPRPVYELFCSNAACTWNPYDDEGIAKVY